MSERATGIAGFGKEWQSEADKNPHIISIDSEEALRRLQSPGTEVKPQSGGIIVVHNNGGELRDAATVARIVREECKLKIPLVYLSNDPMSPKDRIRFLDAGGDAVLTGHDQTLLPKILTNIARRVRFLHESREIIEPFKGLAYDPRAHELKVQGMPVTLTHMEVNVLELFLEAHPRPLAQQEFDTVYVGSKPDSDVLKTIISRLRKKIVPFDIIGIWGTDGEYRYYLSTERTAKI